MNRKDFQKLAEVRAIEAGILARKGKEQGAYYLAGIAIECAIKACIAKKTKRHDFPPERRVIEKVYSHELIDLLKIAGLNEDLDRAIKKRPRLGVNWGVVKDWKVKSRYETTGLKGIDMHMAITGPDGVLTWIRQRW